MQTIEGPFGTSRLVERVSPAMVEDMYRAKCGAEIDFAANGVSELLLYECERTGMRFWRPERVAGDEAFYQQLERLWPFYYRDWRWEYGPALKALRATDRLLEVGCGRGYFLRWTEGVVREAEGIEFNRKAIAETVTRWPVHAITLADMAARQPGAFDVVCSYQVLEHVVDPAGFLRDSLACLADGGRLIVSTPDPENRSLRARRDAFDLPPHHVNHLTLDSYRRIADLLGLSIVRVDRAPLNPYQSRAPGAPRQLSLAATVRLEGKNLAARLLGRRGPTLMVTMVKAG